MITKTMKLNIISAARHKSGERELPAQFREEYRPDLIRRAVLALQSIARQRYGASPEAGLRQSSKLSKRRRKYRGSYGFGISRVNRKILSRRGMRMNWVGAFSPQTRGGHRSHPPKAEKQWAQKINRKEQRKAVRSAIAATVRKEIVQQRGHKVPPEYPFIMESAVEQMQKTSEVEAFLSTWGFDEELNRGSATKVRAGKGKRRGRKYRHTKSLLLVVSKSCPLQRAAANIPGVEAVPVKHLHAGVLAPGALPGRATLWSEAAVEVMEKEKLFS